MFTIFRLAHWLHLRGIPLLPRLLYVFNRIVFSVVLPPSVRCGEDVKLGYSGLGIVIHARARIGSHVVIGTNVTIGGRNNYLGVPVIEDNVEIGTGAKVLGPITIGRGARIGANAVVVKDVPAGATAIGVPARIVPAKVQAE